MKGETLYLKAKNIYASIYGGKQDKSIKKDLYDEYMKYIRMAAYAGHGYAQFDLALEYENINSFESNTRNNPKRSLYWYKKACENGVGEACNNLASYYNTGAVCKVDKIRALALYKKAADLGDSPGKENYRLLKTELRAEDVASTIRKGVIDNNKKNELYSEYLKCLHKSAKAGHPDSQYLLAKQFEEIEFLGSNPNPSHNPKLSFYWYKKACENNVGEACNILASYFEKGISCKKDDIKASKLYEKAKSLGSNSGKGRLE